MKWLTWVLVLLILSLALGFGLLAYAMYVLLGAMLVSRLLTRSWTENLSAVRECNRQIAQIGDKVAVVITVKNAGRLPICWLLLEDVLPIHALIHEPPNLRLLGQRELLTSLWSQGRG
jgi:uncharacterized repeat protein (TIGR01451 family)